MLIRTCVLSGHQRVQLIPMQRLRVAAVETVHIQIFGNLISIQWGTIIILSMHHTHNRLVMLPVYKSELRVVLHDTRTSQHCSASVMWTRTLLIID